MLRLPFFHKKTMGPKEKEPYLNGLSNSQAKEYRILTFFEEVLPRLNEIFSEFKYFIFELTNYLERILHLSFLRFESGKSLFAAILYRQRGKYAKRFVHSGMAGLAALGVMIAPVVAQEFPGRTLDPWEIPSPSSVLSASVEETGISTDISSKPRDKIIDYEGQEGDTVSGVADKFAVSQDTILWQNDLSVS